MKEYDCWLQSGLKAGIKAELVSNIHADLSDGMSLSGETSDAGVLPEAKLQAQTAQRFEPAAVLKQAVIELREGLSRRFGISAGTDANKVGGIYLGTAVQLSAKLGEPLPEAGPEGFHIAVSDSRIVIAGADAAGTLYGVFRFLSLLALGELKAGSAVTETPVCSMRALNHWDNIEGTIERGYAGRSLFFNDGAVQYDAERLRDYARLLASMGINVISLNNVNVRTATKFITEAYLPQIAELAAIFRPYGMRLLISVNFSSPEIIGGMDTSDPLDPKVIAWWEKQTAVVYRHIPDLRGYLIKADSEGEGGPFQYGRTHADGANMLARALKPFGGECVWRCFVYNCTQDWRDRTLDRVRAAYDNFKPLDGLFADNVILQIKHGPYDFQVREPVSPLFGALTKTRYTMELQVTQEYTGHQIDLCYMPWMWQDLMAYHTGYGEGSQVAELLGASALGRSHPAAMEGLAAVANTGLDTNWTGHTLAQANLYGYGRLAWNPTLSAAEIAREWCALTFGKGTTADTVSEILLASYPAYQKNNAPFGVCFMVMPHDHYGPSIEGYEFDSWGTYHRADREAIGIERTQNGTGYTGQYPAAIAAVYEDPARCPENLILFFHRLRYDFRMRNGKTLLQNIYDQHFEGYEETAALLAKWRTLETALSPDTYRSVLARLEQHLATAREWRDQVNTYFYRHTLIPDEKGRKIYE